MCVAILNCIKVCSLGRNVLSLIYYACLSYSWFMILLTVSFYIQMSVLSPYLLWSVPTLYALASRVPISFSRLYRSRRASTINRTPPGANISTPTTANANDQPMLLCSQLGIQSRPSPRAPNVITAINPQMAATNKHF